MKLIPYYYLHISGRHQFSKGLQTALGTLYEGKHTRN